MSSKEFIDKYGSDLIIEHNKSNIVFKTEDKNIKNDYKLKLYFDESVFNEITQYLENIASEIWKDFSPKVANSLSSEYEEYYDKKYDNNGYLDIYKDNIICIYKPDKECPYMYKFNKRRTESFVYDLKKIIHNTKKLCS